MTHTKEQKKKHGFKDDPDFFKKAGSKGGNTTFATHGRDHYVKISKLATAKRWPKL